MEVLNHVFSKYNPKLHNYQICMRDIKQRQKSKVYLKLY